MADRGYLNMVYRGANFKNLYTAYFDGTIWHGNTMIKDQPGGIGPDSSQNPGTCLYKDRFYLVYKGAYFSDLYMTYYDGLKWYGDEKISIQGDTPQSDSYPSLVVYKDLLYAVYKGKGSTNIYTAWFDGKRWYGNPTLFMVLPDTATAGSFLA